MFFIKSYICMIIYVFVFCSTIVPIYGAQNNDISYVYKNSDEGELRLYVTNPPGWAPHNQRPAILFFHGGGWVGGKVGQFVRQANYFASRGLVAVQVEYRLLRRGKKEPPIKPVQDAKSAMRWIRTHALELGIDPDRIATAGGSAGGHLAAFLGTTDGLDESWLGKTGQ